MRKIRVPQHVHIMVSNIRREHVSGDRDKTKLVSTYERVMDRIEDSDYTDLALEVDIKFMENLVARVKRAYWLFACI